MVSDVSSGCEREFKKNYAQFIMLKDVLVEHLDIGAGTLMDVIGLITIVLGLTVLAPLTIRLIIGLLIGR